MRILDEVYSKPSQASGVRLMVFDRPGGVLALEEWTGPSSVIKTLGLFESRESARARVELRARELVELGFARVAPAA
jgi:hypothetical protein